VVIVVEGGIVQGVFADQPIDVVKIEYDTEGCDEADGVVILPDVDVATGVAEPRSSATAEAFIGLIGCTLAPEYVATRFRQCAELDAAERDEANPGDAS
jgi:hypothetical protein